MQPPPTPEIRFTQERFQRSTCKVHLQHIDTFYSCVVCGVSICLELCFLRYHTLKDYYFNDEDLEGP